MLTILADYDRIKKNVRNKLPVIAPMEKQTCGGCHLKVSQEVIGQLKDQTEIHYCDQCGRILY